MALLSDYLQSQAIGSTIEAITGVTPTITALPGNRQRISFSSANMPKIRSYLKNQLLSASKSPIELDFIPIILPYTVLTAITLVLAGVLAGQLARGR